MTNIEYIKTKVSTSDNNIRNTVKLLNEDCTIPFIARYRKDQTGNLDEVQIEDIAKSNNAFDTIVKRKDAILKSISEQNGLTPELEQKISKSFDLNELEDLYLPFKRKKETRADIARENGLEPLAKIIMSQSGNFDHLIAKYINKNIATKEDALQGARDIIAEWINENPYIRKSLRRIFSRQSTITCKVVKAKLEDDAAQKFKQYFDWSENLTKAPSHRFLAMLRAENDGFIKFKIEIEEVEAISLIENSIIKSNSDAAVEIAKAIRDSYKRLAKASI